MWRSHFQSLLFVVVVAVGQGWENQWSGKAWTSAVVRFRTYLNKICQETFRSHMMHFSGYPYDRACLLNRSSSVPNHEHISLYLGAKFPRTA